MNGFDGRAGARVANMGLGAWLIASAFQWPHVQVQQTNALVVGIASIAVAALAVRQERLRWLNVALSAWLFASVFLLPHVSRATSWSNALTALAMLVVALVPNRVGTVSEMMRPATT
jgi:hypothetical protein